MLPEKKKLSSEKKEALEKKNAQEKKEQRKLVNTQDNYYNNYQSH